MKSEKNVKNANAVVSDTYSGLNLPPIPEESLPLFGSFPECVQDIANHHSMLFLKEFPGLFGCHILFFKPAADLFPIQANGVYGRRSYNEGERERSLVLGGKALAFKIQTTAIP